MNTSQLNMLTSIQKRLLLAALSFGLVLTAGAQDFDADWPFYKPLTQTQQFGISPFYGYRFGGEVKDKNTGSKYSFEDGRAYGLFLDYAPMNYYGRYELLWSHQDSSLDFHGDNGLGKVDVTIDVIQLGGVLEFGTKRFREYVSAHAGATHFSSDGYGDDTKFSLGIGGGLKAFLTKNIYLRADLRGFCTVTEAEGSFMYANGVTVASFSGSTFWQGQATAGIGITF
jgi:opacity protein-like surface antigen